MNLKCATTGIQRATSVSMEDVWKFCHRSWWSQIAHPMKYWAFTTLEQVFAYLGSREGRACAILEEVPYVSLG